MRWIGVVLTLSLLAGCSDSPPPGGLETTPPRQRESIEEGTFTSYLNGTVTGVGECRFDQVLPVDEIHGHRWVDPGFRGRRYEPARLDPAALQDGELCMRWIDGLGNYVNQTLYGYEVVPEEAEWVLVMGDFNEPAQYTIVILPREPTTNKSVDDGS